MGVEDRREFKRAYIRLSVEYRGKSTWQMIEGKDISAGGMFVATDTIEPQNTEIEIMFEFGDRQEHKKFVYAKGVVAWTRPKEIRDEEGNVQPAGMGIKFTKLSPLSAKEFINEAVKKLGEKQDA